MNNIGMISILNSMKKIILFQKIERFNIILKNGKNMEWIISKLFILLWINDIVF